ncbi:MAG: HEAT repeat domain-containing protein [Promethearchaeota archaeon]
MSLVSILVPFSYAVIAALFFAFGFLLVYRNLRKINLIEGEKFTMEDWFACVGFGLMFSLVVLFAVNLTFDVIVEEEVLNLGGYILLILLGILFVYPLWEVFFLGRPTSDAVHDFHKFLENKILDRFRGKVAYVVSAMIFVVVYIVPIVVITLLTSFQAVQVAFMWFLIFPLFFLNYFAASGQVGNIISQSYKNSVPADLFPEKPSPVKKLMGLVFLVLAWLPFILSAYNIYSPINEILKGTPVDDGTGVKSTELMPGLSVAQLTAYLSLFTTVVFGIQGFFKRFWNKKSKTKTIDFIFSGYIFIGIGVNMLINFSSIDPAVTASVLGVTIGAWQPLAPLMGVFENSLILLPLVTIQSLIVVVYGSYLLLNRKSDFHADIRLAAVNKAFGIKIDQLAKGMKGGAVGGGEESKPPKYDLPALFKSVLLPPVYTGEGIDLNQPVRQKAAQFLYLISVSDKEKAATVVDTIAKKTVEVDKAAEEEAKERVFVSKEAVDLLGYIGKLYPDLVVDRLVDALGPADAQIKSYILDAFGDVGESKENLVRVLERVTPLLVEPRYEVRLAAFNALVESVTEGEYGDREFVESILGPIYAILEGRYQNPDIIDSALDAVVKLCVKVAEFVKMDKILPFLDYSAGKNERLRGFIVQNALAVLAYVVYYNIETFPVGKIRAFLDDKRSYVRYVAVDAIGNYILKSTDAQEKESLLLDLVERSLHDPDPDVTEICAESITEFLVLHAGFQVTRDGRKQSVLEVYTSMLDDPDPNVAEKASEALKSIAPLYQDDIYPVLLDKIQGSNDELVRDCLHTLALLDENIHNKVNLPLLYSFTAHADASIRSEAVFALGGISAHRDDVDEKVLYKLLDDPDPEVRLQAIFSLGKLGVKKPAEVSQVLIEKLFEIDRESSAHVAEVELYAESLGVIGEVHPSNEIIISLQQVLMGDTNVYAKDIIAKSLGRIGNGMIRSGNATRTIQNEAFYNAVSWFQVSEKKEYTIGNLVIIFIEALQQKGVPSSVMDIISDSIQDLLPVFLFRRVEKEKREDEIMVAIKKLLAQAYYSNYDQEILETIDRVDSLLNFKRSFQTDDPALQRQYEFYAQQYTPDGKQFHDQGETFMLLESQGPEFLDYALRSFRIAIELAPNEYYTPNCYLQRGIIFEKKGDFESARKELENALEAFTALDEVEAMKVCEDHLQMVKSHL